MNNNPIATIEMENGDIMKLELYPDIAPNTVKNFISLASKGFYDGVIFHRVIPGFMIQGGDPQGVGIGGPGYGIKGEFKSNGFANDLKHEKGVISMARSASPDSAGSQFFIMVANSSHLDGQYAAFGKVIEGIEAADKIVAVKRNHSDKPLSDQKMKKVTIDTKGVAYDEPERLTER
jgi:peptidyl-prolyl cis-trans isomerase B (cyclophilin B)